ncbi:MAG: hypothetical protein AAB834_06175, partial [Patescibacteria group bacterium]
MAVLYPPGRENRPAVGGVGEGRLGHIHVYTYTVAGSGSDSRYSIACDARPLVSSGGIIPNFSVVHSANS